MRSRSLIVLIVLVVLVVVIVAILVSVRRPAGGPGVPPPTAGGPAVLPDDPGLPAEDLPHHLARYGHFTLSYNEVHEQPDWVMYRLEGAWLSGERFERRDNFREDPEIPTGTAALSDYRRSGYDRGHLVPAADMSWSETALSETFFMSNMSPQTPAFNRGIWKRLEEQVRDWALANHSLYVVVGPVLREGLPVIGDNGVSIPEYYYKVVLDYREPERKAVAFLMPNEKLSGSLWQWAVPVDSVEARTGFDFFPALPDDYEARLESVLDSLMWQDDHPIP